MHSLILGFQMGRWETVVPQAQPRVPGEGLTWTFFFQVLESQLYCIILILASILNTKMSQTIMTTQNKQVTLLANIYVDISMGYFRWYHMLDAVEMDWRPEELWHG